MPVLTPAEGKFIFDLARPAVTTIGRSRLNQLLGLVQKLHDGIQEAAEREDAAKFLLNAFWLAASGNVSEAQINEHPRLSAPQRADLLCMQQLRYDAEAWRASSGYEVTTPLPTADNVPAPISSEHE